MLTSEEQNATPWGSRSIAEDEAERFALALPLSAEDRRAVVQTLYHFPSECQVRGMFFDGLVNVIKKQRDAVLADELMARAGVRARVIPFALLPHRDFYKLYFVSAPTLYPGDSLGSGMRKIAETFYPVFRDSMVGRTLSAMMGNDPKKVLERLVDAYNMSVQDNEHSVRVSGDTSMIWDCRVEPSPFYAHTFTGIVYGTLASHGIGGARVETISRLADGLDHTRWVFRISW